MLSAESKAPLLRFVVRLSLRVLLVSAVLCGSALGFSTTIDDTTIAFASNRGIGDDIYLLEVKRNLLTVFSDNADRGSFVEGWSADGKYLLVTAFSQDNFDIHILDFQGLSRQLTNDPAFDFAASWSPDGLTIAFSSDRNDNSDIYLMSLESGELYPLVTTAGEDECPEWSPNGEQIAFVSDQDGDAEVYVVNSDGTNLQNITNHDAYDYCPSWSPDGTRLAFGSNRESYADSSEIYITSADGMDIQRVTVSSFSLNINPSWSPDGRYIAFQGYIDAGDLEIYLIEVNGQGLRNLTNFPHAADYAPVWRP